MSNFSKNTMDRIRAKFDASGLSLDKFGQKMGYPVKTARKSAWQFLNKTDDPRLSMIAKCADAFGISPAELIRGDDPK